MAKPKTSCDEFVTIADTAKKWRHWLHTNPELTFDLPKTTSFISSKLRDFGIEQVHEKVGRCGIVALIDGQKSGPTIALRADMDALPMQEKSNVAHKSIEDGKMHACGHDGHCTMLLAAANYLNNRAEFSGRVALIFQPAEESGEGAQAMLDDNLIKRFKIEEIYGMHTRPGVPIGQFAIRYGVAHASSDIFEFIIEGRGGHAGHPHKCRDPFVAVNALYSALHTIVSRDSDPHVGGAISVTAIQGGGAFNIIPDTVLMRGTVRSLNSDLRDTYMRRIREIVDGIEVGYDVTIQFAYKSVTPICYNHQKQTQLAADCAKRVVGEDAVEVGYSQSLGGEDFGYFLQSVPGAMIFLGNGNSESLHNGSFDFDDKALPYGIAYWCKLVEARLPSTSGKFD